MSDNGDDLSGGIILPPTLQAYVLKVTFMDGDKKTYTAQGLPLFLDKQQLIKFNPHGEKNSPEMFLPLTNIKHMLITPTATEFGQE